MKKVGLLFLMLFSLNGISQKLDLSQPSVIKKIKKKLKADSIIPDHINEDAVYIALDTKTKKWGMYQDYRAIIPAQYDSIKFFYSNDLFTFVWNNGKLGIGSLSDWDEGVKGFKESIPCIYDEAKITTYWNRDVAVEERYLKLRKGDKWGMVNPTTGDILVDFKYDTYKDVKPSMIGQ